MKYRNRIISVILCLMIIASSGLAAFADDRTKTVKDLCFDFLTQNLGLCPAAAVGIMGNIMVECTFNPEALAMDINGKYSFGLMMWNGVRYDSLKQFCKDNGYETTDPTAQLLYLETELNSSEKEVYSVMKNIPNTIEGVCKAAIEWARLFERCVTSSYGLRIYYALNDYWTEYCGGTKSNTPGIYGYYYNVPENIKTGSPLTLYGVIVSYSSNLSSAAVGVYDEKGKLVTGKSITNDIIAENIAVLDRYVVFNSLTEGTYYYVISAKNGDGEFIVDRQPFTVSNKDTKANLVKESKGGVICTMGASCPSLKYIDTPPATNWAHEGIDFVLNTGVFTGVSNDRFCPKTDMTRAMFVTVLSRLIDLYSLGGVLSAYAENERYVSGDDGKQNEGFSDVPNGKWYYDSVMRLADFGIVEGYEDGTFCPDKSVTREEMAVLIYRFLSAASLTSGTSDIRTEDYSDYEETGDWAKEGLSYSVKSGIIKGSKSSEGLLYLLPKENASREQVAAMIMRIMGLIGK